MAGTVVYNHHEKDLARALLELWQTQQVPSERGTSSDGGSGTTRTQEIVTVRVEDLPAHDQGRQYDKQDQHHAVLNLRAFLINGCDARPEDRHHALQDLDTLAELISSARGESRGTCPKCGTVLVLKPHGDKV
jgi:hypothetical protein